MVVIHYVNKRNPHKIIEIHCDGYSHYAVKQMILAENGVTTFPGDGHLHRWRLNNLRELLNDYEESEQMIVAQCNCCGRTESFPLTENEYDLLSRYRCYGRQMGTLQNLFPRVPAWIRSGAIDLYSGGFCICPRCSR